MQSHSISNDILEKITKFSQTSTQWCEKQSLKLDEYKQTIEDEEGNFDNTIRELEDEIHELKLEISRQKEDIEVESLELNDLKTELHETKREIELFPNLVQSLEDKLTELEVILSDRKAERTRAIKRLNEESDQINKILERYHKLFGLYVQMHQGMMKFSLFNISNLHPDAKLDFLMHVDKQGRSTVHQYIPDIKDFPGVVDYERELSVTLNIQAFALNIRKIYKQYLQNINRF